MASASTPSLRTTAARRSQPRRQSSQHNSMAVQLPSRFQGINEDEEVDSATTTVDAMVQERSLYGMIAQAGDLNQFSGRWQQDAASDIEEEDEAQPTQPSRVSTDTMSASTPNARAHKKKLSESRLLKTFLKPGRRDFENDQMSQSQILPPPPSQSLPERPASVEPKIQAPVLDQRLKAQARAARVEAGEAAQSPRASQESLARRKPSPALSNVLAEIFSLDTPEDVIAEYPCWFLQSNLLQGYMYITQKHLCFYAYLQKKTGSTLKSGYLGKRGKQNPRYHRYWFVLKGTVFTYYADPAQPYFPSGSIDLRYGITAELSGESNVSVDKTNFTITTDTAVYQFRADSLTSAQEWVKQIQKVIFRTHNDGDSVKVLLPLDNVVDVSSNPVIGSTDTISLRVVDPASLSIDEYFFTFFSNSGDIIEVLSTMTANNTAKTTLSADKAKAKTLSPQRADGYEEVRTTLLTASPDSAQQPSDVPHRPVATRGRSSFERHRQAEGRPHVSRNRESRMQAEAQEDIAQMSASQILSDDRAFKEPTRHALPLRRANDPASGHGSKASSLATTDTDLRTTDVQSRPTLTALSRTGSIADYMREQGKRMSTYLSGSPRDYYDKLSGALAGGKRHYMESDGLAPEDRVDDEDELEVAEHERRFRDHFALPDSERLVAVYYTSLHRVLPLYGKIYLGTRYFCFRSLLPGSRTKIVIPLPHVDNVEKERGFRFGYPGMVLVLRGHEELFFDFRDSGLRDDCVVTILRTLDTIVTEPEDESDEGGAAAENKLLEETRREQDIPSMDDSFDDQEMFFDDTSASMLDFKPKQSLRIVCLTIGSRGDVQPYIALCKGLLAEGHRPKIATHVEFGDWVKKHGIDFEPVGGNPAELMRLCVELGMFTPKFLYETNSKFRGWLDELLVSSWQACQGADVLIESPSAMAGIHIAEALGIPYFRAFTMMWTRTRAYPHAFAAINYKLGGTYNLTTYGLFENIFWQMTANQINRWRMKVLKIGPTSSNKLQQNKVPFLYNFSPSFVPPPLDYSDWVRVTGYWFLDEGEEFTPPADLLKFIQQARADNMKLVYIGFGSVVVTDSRALTKSVVDAVVKADVRCILSKGWSDRLDAKSSGLPEIEIPPCIHQIGSVPHDWLFRQVDAAVHHGGAGTTGASLRAGIPTVIKPFFGDQYFSASRVENLGVGMRIDLISQNVLGKALWIATHDDRMRTKARKLGERIRAEDGVGTAIKTIYRDLEYATTLIKQKNAKPLAADDGSEDEEESWTFVDADKDVDDMLSSEEFTATQIPDSQRQASRYSVYQLGSLVAKRRFI